MARLLVVPGGRFPGRALTPFRPIGEGMPPGMAPGDADPNAPAPAVTPKVPPSVEATFLEYLEDGPHEEVRKFEALVVAKSAAWSSLGHPRNVWDFIADAVDGVGGFATGDYLYPFRMELQKESASGLLNWDEKYLARKLQADVDAFAGDICNAPLDLIASKSDMIKRQIADQRAAAWAQDVDGEGTPLGDYMEPVFREARRYGVAWIFMDRPAVPIANMRQDLAPENKPYPYLVPTRNVRTWTFDARTGELLAIAVCEPDEDDPAGCAPEDCATRVWTREGWALYTPIDKADHSKREGWTVTTAAFLELGRIPVVRVVNDRPAKGCSGLGQTEMLKVARLQQSVFNMESESREIERKAAYPQLTMPVRDAKEFAGGEALVGGVESVLIYDGEAGAPAYLQPNLDVLESYERRKEAKKAAAYKLANLDALAGSTGKEGGSSGGVQGSSGFHLEVAFSKTERRIARYAGNLEAGETALLVLCLQWYGMDRETAAKAVEIAYPREFGVRDMDRLLDRTTKELDTFEGDEPTRQVLDAWFRSRFPRKNDPEIQALVDSEMKKRASMKAQLAAATAKAQQAITDTRDTAMARSVVKGT